MTTIHRNLSAPADTRVVFSKYDPGHLLALSNAITKHQPTNLNEIPKASEAIHAELKNKGIILMSDSRIFLFDAIWDQLPKETKNEPDQPTGNEPHQQV